MLKIAVIGGGSTYTPELIKGFINLNDQLPVNEIWLMDIDESRLKIVGTFAQRMVAAIKKPFKIILTADRSAALKDADYVITQFRIGNMAARREDEYLGRRNFLIGQEAIGVGGMANALRTIPVILDIAHDMRKLAPKALLINLSNPSGIITEALNRHAPDINVVGVCNSAINTKIAILESLSNKHGQTYQPGDGELLSLGLNHLSWYYGFKLKGNDVWQEVFESYVDGLEKSSRPAFYPAFIRKLGLIPNYYLEYYYNEDLMVREQDSWPPSRAEEVMKIKADLISEYANPQLVSLPESLKKHSDTNYSTVAIQLINSHFNDLGETHIVNVSHQGAVSDWEKDWVLELPCRVDRNGFQPLPAQPLPLFNYILLEQVKNYVIMTIEAAVHGDRFAAQQALRTHPLGPVDEHVEIILKDMLETHREYLPLFF